MTIAALIVAAGRGTRAGGVVPKQYARLGSRSVLGHTVDAFAAVPEIHRIQCVIHSADEPLYSASIPSGVPRLAPPAAGGATRQASVRAGLEALARSSPRLVLIHDAARPFVTPKVIRDVLGALATSSGALAAVPLADTLKRAAADGHVAETVDRSGLWRAQTPQGFHFQAILDAHRRAAAAGREDFTDDAAIAEWAGIPVALVTDSADNAKITTEADLTAAERRLAVPIETETRTGAGFDVHRFAPGTSVWLCGIEIPHTHRLEGHSDADVALHALTDAILGALGDGDIGQHFPPSDPQWKGAASRLFLADAARRVTARGGRIVNVDVTILCEAPRIGPHREAMRKAVAEILAIGVDRVGVKATTTEGLGFTGRREGIAAMATATLMLPLS